MTNVGAAKGKNSKSDELIAIFDKCVATQYRDGQWVAVYQSYISSPNGANSFYSMGLEIIQAELTTAYWGGISPASYILRREQLEIGKKAIEVMNQSKTPVQNLSITLLNAQQLLPYNPQVG